MDDPYQTGANRGPENVERITEEYVSAFRWDLPRHNSEPASQAASTQATMPRAICTPLRAGCYTIRL